MIANTTEALTGQAVFVGDLGVLGLWGLPNVERSLLPSRVSWVQPCVQGMSNWRFLAWQLGTNLAS